MDEWININECLPEVNKVVLVYGAVDPMCMAYLNSDKKWIDHCDEERIVGVTDWTTLPVLPKRKNHE